MNFIEFIRTFWIPILVGIVATPLILFIVNLIFSWMGDKIENGEKIWIKRIRNLVIGAMWISIALGIIFSASLNLFPRSEINSNPLEKQQQQWENNHK
jgi:hypothetical protein